MSMLSRLIGFSSAAERAGISLGSNAGWRIRNVKEASPFFGALAEFASSDMVLAFHDPSNDELASYLKRNQSERMVKVEAGTAWPKSNIFHLDCTPENLRFVRQISERSTGMELAIHLHLYQEGKVILEWYDAFDEPIEFSEKLNEARVQEFAERAGGKCERIET